MRTPKTLSLTAKLALMVILFLAIFTGALIAAQGVIERVKVNGPVYSSIVQSKDLVADILPPPAYIIESYLGVLQMVDETDPATLGQLVEHGAQLRSEFDTRIAHWERVLPAGPIRDAMLGPAHDAAERFFALRDEQLIPMLRAGNREGATQLSRGAMRLAYDEHRRSVDRVVELALAESPRVGSAGVEFYAKVVALAAEPGCAVLQITASDAAPIELLEAARRGQS